MFILFCSGLCAFSALFPVYSDALYGPTLHK